MSENTRPRGVVVYPFKNDKVNGPYNHYALLLRESGDVSEVRMVHTEGVSYSVTDEKPWRWTDYDPNCPVFTREELLDMTEDADQVDLADWVRSFGSRLEINFNMAYSWAMKS